MSANPSPGSEAPLPPELRPLNSDDPRRIGPYRVVGRLGSGGMGTVYGALDDAGACIAVKVVHDRYADDPAFRTAFAQEVELMRRIEGIYAVAVHAADTEAARPWVATDFVPGVTLRARVEREGPLEPDMLLAFAAGTAEALTAIHAAGIVHCDVKPGNVMLTPDGPRILDFGIARPVSRSAVERSGGRVFGSPGWVSPERYRGGEPKPPADVFAWGCVVAYAATGRPPFGRGDSAELRRRALETAPDLDGLPDALRPLVELAVTAEPAARPTAESAYRGLIEFSTPQDTSRIQTRDLGDLVRGLVSQHWRGIDVSWHNPALWLAAAPVVGAAGGTALAAGAAGGAGAAGAGAAGAGASAGAAASAGAGAGTGAAASGAATVAGVTGGFKVAALTASAVIVVGGLSAGGYFAAGSLTDSSSSAEPQSSPSPSPSPTLGTPDEIVAGIIGNLESAESYRAVEASTPTEGLGGQTEYVFATVDGEQIFHSVSIAGTPESPEYIAGRIYRPQDEWLIERIRNGGESTGFYTMVQGAVDQTISFRHTRDAVLWPFEDLAATMQVAERADAELEGEPAVRIAGTFDMSAPAGAGGSSAPGMDFELWTGLDGFPLRLDYSFDSGEPMARTSTTVTYSGFDGLDHRICGAVEGVPRVDRALLVPAVGSIACEDVRPAVEEYLAMPDDQKEGPDSSAEVSGWTCALSSPVTMRERISEEAGICFQGDAASDERVDFIRLD